MYDFEGISVRGVTGIRYGALSTNEWIEFIVIPMEKEKISKYIEAVDKGMFEFWNDDSGLAYGNCVENALNCAELPYMVYYYDPEFEGDERYDCSWEKFLRKFDSIITVDI